MGKRAERQAETRLRIVEAAVDLHCSIGPATTTFTMVAERAGVQRHTLYAHFPDERSLLMACSGLTQERDPLPDPASLREIADAPARLRAGLRMLYDWYARNEDLLGRVMRDAESNALVREINDLRFGPTMAAYHDILGARLGARQRAMLRIALSFPTWRSLVRDSGLIQGAATALMTHAIETASH